MFDAESSQFSVEVVDIGYISASGIHYIQISRRKEDGGGCKWLDVLHQRSSSERKEKVIEN